MESEFAAAPEEEVEVDDEDEPEGGVVAGPCGALGADAEADALSLETDRHGNRKREEARRR